MSQQLHHEAEATTERNDTARKIRRYAREAHRHVSQGMQQVSAIAENALHTMQDLPAHDDPADIGRVLEAIAERLDQCSAEAERAVDDAVRTYAEARKAAHQQQEKAGQSPAPQDADLIGGEASKTHAAVLQLSRLTTATCGQLQAISRNAAYVVAEVGLCQHERIANVFGMIRDYAEDRTDDAEGIAYSAGFAYEDEAQQQRNRASILARTRRQRKDGEA